jgi:hypothetical protein
MKGSKARAIMLFAFVIALSAGTVGGILLSRLPLLASAQASSSPVALQLSLTEALELSPDQAQKMRKIWEGSRDKSHGMFAEAQDLQKGRDDALVSLLNDEQKAKYEKIAKEYADRFAALTARRDSMFQDSVEQTKSILSASQQKKYEEILRSRLGPKMNAGKELLPPPVLLPDTQVPKTSLDQ